VNQCCVVLILSILLTACVSKDESAVNRHSWGDPNLQGTWDYRTATPLAAPAAIGNRIQFTEAEKNEFEQQSTARGVAFVRRVGNYVGDEPWADRGLYLTEDNRAALITVPANGQLPNRTTRGKAMAGRYFAQMSDVEVTGPEDRTVLERCIVGPLIPLRPMNFNNNVQIVQSPTHVLIMTEMVHDARIVPIQRSNRPLQTTGLPHWLGESRGHWENQTLVVETSNFRAYPNLLGTSPDLQLTERFTLADSSHLVYEYTVNDPEVFQDSWSARQTLSRLDGQIYEYACHEGNVSMGLMLRGARLAE
jgi:hypothetical protein